MDGKFLTPRETSERLQVTTTCLINWEKAGKITCFRTKGGHRRFRLSDILKIQQNNTSPPTRKKICYCRVSSSGQKEDLNRQAELFRLKYPDHNIIKDVGSGLNFERKGFNAILDEAIRGNIEELVITHKDRLCRFGYPIIEKILNSTNGKLVVLDTEETTPEKELVNDLITIITVFSSRVYGLRSHKIKSAIKTATKIQDDEVQTVSNGEREECISHLV